MNGRQHVAHGLVAGLIAATVFAAWFFVIDLIQHEPFRTPAYMSGLIFSFADGLPEGVRLAAFTLIHLLAFGFAGIATSAVFGAAGVTPSVGLGMIIGFLLFDLVFYGGIVLFGVNVVHGIGWPQVLTGNVLAGAVLGGYLRAKQGRRVLDVQAFLARNQTVRQGTVAGLIGAAVVAILFLFVDIANGRMFYTPAALGSALFFGANKPDDVVISALTVLGYSVVHVAAFVLAGLFAARVATEAEAHPPMLIGLALVFVTLEVLSLGMLTALASWLFQTLPWWMPIVANLFAAGAMAGYLWRAHPVLRERFGQPLEDPV